MTALAGIMALHATYQMDAMVDAMLVAQACYARTPSVCATIGAASLGRALYPTLAEDAFDTGPQISSDGHAMCVADVRLDNRVSLIIDLQIAPSDAAAMCDAALVLAAWQSWGTAAFDRLRGDFAIAVYDLQQQRLYLARDFLGQRPLFYHQAADMLAFASMPSGLLALPSLEVKGDEHEFADYLLSRRSRPLRSFFKGITPVPAGHWLEFDGQHIRVARYWYPPAAASAGGDRQSRTAKARQLFDSGIAARLRDAGSLASHLSGGMDSGAVTLATASQLPDDQPIIAYTAVPPPQLRIAEPIGRFINESALACISAGRASNIQHHCISADPAQFSNRWDQAVTLFQRPLHGPCNYRWLAAIYDAAQSAGVNTLLIGQVGNLSVSYQLPAHSPLATAGVPLWRRKLRPLARWVRDKIRAARGDGHRQHFLKLHGLTKDEAPTDHPMSSYAERLASLALLDFGQNSKGVLGGWGIDLRDPTADRDLIDFCLSLPDEDFVVAGWSRGLARRAFADLLPPEVLNDDRRGLQTADWRLAMLTNRAALLDQIGLARAHADARELIDFEALELALQTMSDDPSLGQADDMLLRLGALRALAAGHFIHRSISHPNSAGDVQ